MAGELSLLLAGDALITRRWSQVDEPAFLRLVEEIRAADVAITNLETVIHEFKGFAQLDSGGAYMASPPAIAGELKWAGFDMLAHANNHAFDYGSSAILETIGHVEEAGLVLAGSGRDLQHARAPRYFDSRGVVVALVAMTSSFVRYGRASRSRPELHGRPGVNPLTLTARKRAIVVPPGAADRIRSLGRIVGRRPGRLADRSFKVGLRFHEGNRFALEYAPQLLEADRAGNLDAVSEAASKADIVVASIHAHRQGRWLREFAHDAVKRGADVVFVHGPHEVRAVEFYCGKPIFYSMGDFVFEIDDIERFPSDAYDRYRLGDTATAGDLIAAMKKRSPATCDQPQLFEGFVAVLSIGGGRVSRIRLLPIDLQFDAAPERRGRPRLASPEMGERIIGAVAALSRRHGTRIRYDASGNFGEVEIRYSPAGTAPGWSA